jgi:ABC-type sugar transport system permease subunit
VRIPERAVLPLRVSFLNKGEEWDLKIFQKFSHKRLNQTKREQILSWTFIMPAMIIFIIFMFWPLAYTFYLSLFKWNMVAPVKKFVGFDNYISLFKDPVTWELFSNTLLYVVILVIFNFILDDLYNLLTV